VGASANRLGADELQGDAGSGGMGIGSLTFVTSLVSVSFSTIKDSKLSIEDWLCFSASCSGKLKSSFVISFYR